jgi:predicted TIM-barrel fold metal-dependent hydrolase
VAVGAKPTLVFQIIFENSLHVEARVKPSDLKAEAERLKAAGEMPSFEEVLAAITAVRMEYEPKIKAARKAAREKRKP